MDHYEPVATVKGSIPIWTAIGKKKKKKAIIFY